jgi:hypothetical protein
MRAASNTTHKSASKTPPIKLKFCFSELWHRFLQKQGTPDVDPKLATEPLGFEPTGGE